MLHSNASEPGPAPIVPTAAAESDSGSDGHSDRPIRRWKPVALTIAVTLAIVVAINHELVTAFRNDIIPKRWGVVEPGRIYRSGQISRRLIKKMLQSHHIARVVDLTFDDPGDQHHNAELAAIAELGIERRLCPLHSDGTGDVHIYAEAVSAVADSARRGEPVLVHCAAGTQRTGGVVALYRLLVEEKPPEFVFDELRQYKYDPKRSPKLVEYLNAHIGEIAADLVRSGTISSVPNPLPKLSSNGSTARRADSSATVR